VGTVFTQISAAAFIKVFAPQMQRLFEGGAYLKIGMFRRTIVLVKELSRKQTTCTSNWKKEEISWACCAGKVRGLYNRTTYCKNSG